MRFTWRGREHRVDIAIAVGVALMVALAAAIVISRVVPLRRRGCAGRIIARNDAQRGGDTGARPALDAARPDARGGARSPGLTHPPHRSTVCGRGQRHGRGRDTPDWRSGTRRSGPTLRPRPPGPGRTSGPTRSSARPRRSNRARPTRSTIPAGTFALRHRTLGRYAARQLQRRCQGSTAVQETLARLGHLPYTLRGFVGASSLGPVTRRGAQRAFEPPRNGVLLTNVRDAPPLRQGVLGRDDDRSARGVRVRSPPAAHDEAHAPALD